MLSMGETLRKPLMATREKITVERAKELIAKAPGCRLVDDLANRKYPMPLDTSDQDIVFVGRIREDLTCERGLNDGDIPAPEPHCRTGTAG